MAGEGSEAGRFSRVDAGENVGQPHFTRLAAQRPVISRSATAQPPGDAHSPDDEGAAATCDATAAPVVFEHLDGTHIATDVCAEWLLVAARSRPMLVPKFGWWLLLHGRAVAKHKLAAALPLNLRSLPLRAPVPRSGSATPRLRVLRPKQWVKNLLLFVPLLLAHQVRELGPLWNCCLAFVAFSAVASAIYVVNDLADLAADRLHPEKRHRPFAAGALPLWEGPCLVGLLLTVGLAISLAALPLAFGGLLALYVVLTGLYSLWLKRKVVIDVILLAGFYTLRVFAGGVAAGVVVSEWLLVFSMFLFLSLAFAKRYVELARAADSGAADLHRRSYLPTDLNLFENLGSNSGYLAVLVLALYIHSDHTRQLYPRAWPLWLLCPLLLYWITRVWFLARRRQLSEDPVTYAVHDAASWATAAAAMLIVLAAAAT